MTHRRWMTKNGKRVPLRGGMATMHKAHRESPAIKDKLVMPAKGNLFGTERLGTMGALNNGKPIVKDRKPKKGEGSFGI